MQFYCDYIYFKTSSLKQFFRLVYNFKTNDLYDHINNFKILKIYFVSNNNEPLKKNNSQFFIYDL